METLKVENLSFKYPEAENDTLKNISFTIHGGEFVTLCGLSASGKTTLLRHFKPALAANGQLSGMITLNGVEINCLSQREQTQMIGYIGQSPDNQIVTDKVWHELAFGLENLELPNAVIRCRVAETASFFGIQSFFEKSVNELSGGQKQLLNLAAVMAMQPEILILDEPTSQLDPIAASEFLSCISKINRELGTTVIITEHRLDEIMPASDRVLVIENGEIICDSTPKNIGKVLKEWNSHCFQSLPAPMRIWNAVEDKESDCPVTVAQGREWLNRYLQTHSFTELYKEDVPKSEETAISLKNIWFRYEKESPDVIKNLSINIRYGEFLTIVGGNGTGKSTLLSLINGSHKPYHGTINSNNELLLTLYQNPQLLFDGKTVKETLLNFLNQLEISEEEKQKRMASVIKLCGLQNLLNRHPFDLSGGETQKTALAKLLLLKPRVLLLDEPTKGLDPQFKAVFAKIIHSLTKSGVAVVMVSHDIEFCAQYSHRCVMMFNGELIAEGTPRAFFSSNSFYVTSACRMSKGILPDAVTAEDVIYCCTGLKTDPFDTDDFDLYDASNTEIAEDPPKKKCLWKRISGVVGVLLLVFGIMVNLDWLPVFRADFLPLWGKILFIAVPVVLLLLSQSEYTDYKYENDVSTPKTRLSKRTKVAAAMILFAIPVTIFIGTVYLSDQKNLFISLLVMLECMLPFFLIFEGRKPQARELVIIAVLCAITVGARTAFLALPQIKPVLALVIISGISLGSESGFMIGAISMLISNIYFGQGAWTPWQMFAAGIIGFLSGMLFHRGILGKNRLLLSIYGFVVTILIYGLIMNYSSLILSHTPINRDSLIAFFAQGLPLDILHALSTAVMLFLFAHPMLVKLNRIKTKYRLL